MGGFDKPILHGLCTYGVSCKLMLEKLCDNNTMSFKEMSGRFTSHVLPGETLILNAWKIDGNKYYFETTTQEREKVVLLGTFTIESYEPKL